MLFIAAVIFVMVLGILPTLGMFFPDHYNDKKGKKGK